MIIDDNETVTPSDEPSLSAEKPSSVIPTDIETPPKIKALHLFSRTGSLAAVSRELNIPIYELHQLSRTDWWQRELTLLRREEAALENAKLTSLWGKTLESIEDLLENGEEVYVDGHKRTKKPNGATLARLADVIFNKRQLLRDEPTVTIGGNKKLDELAEKLAQLGSERRKTLTIDHEE